MGETVDQRVSKKKRKQSKNLKGRDILPAPTPLVNNKKEEVARRWHFFLALVGVLCLVSYYNSLNNQFVFDDLSIIRDNPTIRGIERIPDLLGLGGNKAYYRPIRMISYAVDYTLNNKVWRSAGGYWGNDKGLNPLGYHISNIAYHLVTSLLVFLVVVRLVANDRVAFLATTLFALHPVHTDSVTYLSGRRDILFTLFYLTGFYFFLCYRANRKSKFIILSFLAYLLSLGSKEMGVTLPAIFLCYDLVENYSGKAGKINLTYFKELFLTLKKVIVKSKYLYSLLFSGGLAFSFYKVFIKSTSYQSSYYGDSMLTTFLTVGRILVYYIKLLLYPICLSADYFDNAFPLSTSFFEPATLFSFITLGVIGYIVLHLLLHHRLLAFSIIWFFVTLLPVCHIFPHHELLAEHYLYLPSFGYCLVVALLCNRMLRGGRYSFFIYASFVVVLLLFSFRIVDRNRDWRNEITLWEKTIKTVPRCARAHTNLGYVYSRFGRVDEAIAQYKRAIAIKPDFAFPHNHLGRAYTYLGRLDDAITEFKQAITIKPDYFSYTNLGNAYQRKGRLDEAITTYKRALEDKPRYAVAHCNLGIAYAKKGMLDEAIAEQREALTIKPNFLEAQVNLGMSYYQKGDLDEAINAYRRALEIDSNLPSVHNNLAAAYLQKKQYQLAIIHCDKAMALGFNVKPNLLQSLQPYR